mmetsp:Transcript_42244/g.83357  ORF Transcript_42244/g.83357 Transcript_42244/m.83357 type:complete len:85 (+) Transcript_42244:349-603(+)
MNPCILLFFFCSLEEGGKANTHRNKNLYKNLGFWKHTQTHTYTHILRMPFAPGKAGRIEGRESHRLNVPLWNLGTDFLSIYLVE